MKKTCVILAADTMLKGETDDNTAAVNTGPNHPVTTSGRPIRRVYGPTDAADLRYERDLGEPGAYPYTRGVHASGYRGKLWTMRMFAGFGSAKETNARFRYLLSQGNSGLSVAFDLPTLYGYDTDAPEAYGEFGKCGVGVSSLQDMEVLLDGLPLADITTSMTINSPAAIIWAMYIAAAEKRGVLRSQLAGTLQNDILKEFIAQKEFIFPPEPSMRLVVDTIEFGTREMPKWNTISISGYHIREAGSTAVQELAFTLADGFEYVKWTLDRGLDIDEFAPRLSFFFNCHNDFFEEVAKFRAARRIWAREMREKFEVRLKNNRKEQVEVVVIESMFRWRNWTLEAESQPHTASDDGLRAHFRVKIPAGGETTLTYTVRYHTW